MEKGQIVRLTFEGREFEAIVIDPDGLGQGQPSIGFGFRMADRYIGIPRSTLSDWTRVEGVRENGEKVLYLPSGKAFRVSDISGFDGNEYSVIEASDWFGLAIDVLVNPGKTGKGVRAKIGDFIGWFAVKGFYSEAYVVLKGVYTEKDSRATTAWLEARQLGKGKRKIYTDLLQAQGCQNFDYAHWTDHVYLGLFGMKAKEMKQVWELVDGDRHIARNYIPKELGLQAVAYCEDMVVRLFVDNLEEAHNDAIKYTKRKFLAEN